MLKAAVAKFLAHQKAKIAEKKRAGPVKPTGKQTVKHLVGQNQGVANIEISDKNIKDFDRVARKYGVDYAVKKGQDPLATQVHGLLQSTGRGCPHGGL